nr:Chain A, lah4 [synthetic construct]2KJO_A Chain A, lah4 [synthetic construct]
KKALLALALHHLAHLALHLALALKKA